MTPSSGILTSLLNDFQNIFIAGLGNIKMDALWLLGALITLDFLLAVLLNLDNPDQLKMMIEKVLKYGFFIYIVTNYSQLANVILKSFSKIGIKAGGYGISLNKIADPSAIAEYGMHVAQPIFNHAASYHGWNALFNIGDIINCNIVGYLIVGCFFFMGIQFFLTYLEFYCIGCLALILIPFGVNKHTAFIGEKAIAAVFSFGIKLMVLSFIASAAIPLVSRWVIPSNPSLQVMFHILLGSLAIAFLAWSAPNIAMGLLSGSPSLSAAGAVGGLVAGGAAAVGAKMALLNAVGGAMRGAGAISQAARMGVQAGGGFRGAMQGVGRLAAANSSFGQGRISAHRNMSQHNRAMNAAGMQNRLSRPRPTQSDPPKVDIA